MFGLIQDSAFYYEIDQYLSFNGWPQLKIDVKLGELNFSFSYFLEVSG